LTLLPECCASRPALLLWQPGWTGQQVQLQNLAMHLPATLLAGLGTPFNTLGFDGTVALTSEQLQLKLPRQVQGQGPNWQLQGAAQLQLLQISSSLATLPVLGSYQITVAGAGAANTRVQLSTLTGALQLQGDGGWQNGRFSFAGQAQAAPGSEESLANILNVIGQRNGAVSVFRF
jgi:general secretion pathway protein N